MVLISLTEPILQIKQINKDMILDLCRKGTDVYVVSNITPVA